MAQLIPGRKFNEPLYDPTERFFDYVDKASSDEGCWLWTGALARGGYGTFFFAGKQKPSHRVVWLPTVGEIPIGLWVLHKCDVRSCVNPDHLFLGSRQDNMTDMVNKGRSSHKPSFGHRWLSQEDVDFIRQELADGKTQKYLAELFGVKQPAISKIKLGLTWK